MDQGNRRLGMVSCYESGSGKGVWGRPIEGVVAVVDYDERKVVDLIDTGPVPIPAGGPAVNPDQPDTMPAQGPAQRRFQMSGQWIEWDKWRFHLRIDPRVGPVLSQVSIRDGSRADKGRRSVMYEGSISEMFVPYMDPGGTWYFRTYLDVGEYGIGSGGVPLRLGKDCPDDGALVDAAFMNEGGKVYSKKGIACIFERATGDAAWSHYEVRQDASLARRQTELVVRFIVWLGNYDYVIDWIFTETGALKVRVGATGIVQVKAVASQDMAAESAGERHGQWPADRARHRGGQSRSLLRLSPRSRRGRHEEQHDDRPPGQSGPRKVRDRLAAKGDVAGVSHRRRASSPTPGSMSIPSARRCGG